LMLSAGAAAIPMGWLAERFGPAKIITVAGLLTALSMVLTSRVTDLWQLYLAFGFIQGIAIGGTIAITSGLTARWFVKRRGLALGMVSAAIGIGTLIGPPIAERLISSYGWSQASLIIGIGTGIVIIVSSLFLKRDPKSMGLKPYGESDNAEKPGSSGKETSKRLKATEITLGLAMHTTPIWIFTSLFFLLNISVQVVMANYATDLGFDPFTAAIIVSVIGIGSIIGRLVMGFVADRIGSANSLIFTSLLLTASLVWLIFARDLWMLYVFAIFFSFAYGGEVPQIPLLISQFYGLGAVISLTAVTTAGIRAGGALGSLLGGEVFDLSHSYTIAFIIAAIVASATFVICLLLNKIRTKYNRPIAT
jgi:OFA family oxalate/formate antiporter-like MFS transporter